MDSHIRILRAIEPIDTVNKDDIPLPPTPETSANSESEAGANEGYRTEDFCV
jgi:hypothetical protein